MISCLIWSVNENFVKICFDLICFVCFLSFLFELHLVFLPEYSGGNGDRNGDESGGLTDPRFTGDWTQKFCIQNMYPRPLKHLCAPKNLFFIISAYISYNSDHIFCSTKVRLCYWTNINLRSSWRIESFSSFIGKYFLNNRIYTI